MAKLKDRYLYDDKAEFYQRVGRQGGNWSNCPFLKEK